MSFLYGNIRDEKSFLTNKRGLKLNEIANPFYKIFAWVLNFCSFMQS